MRGKGETNVVEESPRGYAYVGNYTRIEPYPRGRAEGVNVYDLDLATGNMRLVQTAPGALNPTFVTLDPSQRRLYAVNAVPEIDGHPGGAVSAYSIDPADGRLTYLNRVSSGGEGPCFVAVESTGRFVLVANYGGGSVAVLPIQPDGSLGPATDFVQHEGSSVNPRRQEKAHAHSINVDPSNRRALVCDLGLDRVMVYRLDLDRGKLTPNEEPWVAARPGAGPRHLSFHPSGRYAYVINELDSTITVYAYDDARGALRELQSVSTLPEGFSGESHTAEVRVAPSGKLVYGSNRGHDSIAIFAVDETTGKLASVGHEPSQGRIPRNFTIDPSGSLMLVANQDTDTIVAFRIDPGTGRLSATGAVTESPSPVCVKIVPIGR